MQRFLTMNVFWVGLGSIMLLAFTLVTPTVGIADDSESQILREPKEEVLVDGIETGQVIAFGRLTRPPYRVTVKSNKIFINEFQVLPRKTRSEKEAKKIEVLESTRNKHELIQTISNRYVDWVIESDKKEAKLKLIDFVKNQPLIDGYELKGESLLITFTDGNSEELLLHTARMKREGNYPSNNELEKMRLDYGKRMQKALEKGMIIAFGYDYTLLIPELSAKENISYIRNILSKSASEDEKTKSLQKKFKKKAFVQDLISNQGSW